MSIANLIQLHTAAAIRQLYGADLHNGIAINTTKADFEGDFTVVLFSLLKPLRQSPDALGNALGNALLEAHPNFYASFNVVKGFLNLTLHNEPFWQAITSGNEATDTSLKGQKIIVEYASPNTNKPLHLGHLRNIFLGWSVAALYKAAGAEVRKASIVNDRGIHICKSMLAWQRWGADATPQSTGAKGDHFVGDYYVKFSEALKEEVATGVAAGKTKEAAEKESPLMTEAAHMLRAWEAGDEGVRKLWADMNGWVYQGFNTTYTTIGADFDKTYYESETYLLGKTFVEEGLASGVFLRKPDGSVWIDLTEDGLDEKLVLRADGTSVYITQDLGLADEKYRWFPYDRSVYVIADEQNYHMKVLGLILQKLGKPYADGIHHLSYGMVELPTGRMKSREGTVVDADDIVAEMVAVAQKRSEESVKLDGLSEEEKGELYRILGLGALKFYLLRVDPKKKMVFNPEESVDLHGFTAAFIQYTHARIRSILRRGAGLVRQVENLQTLPLLSLEKTLLTSLVAFVPARTDAARDSTPSTLAMYLYELAQTYNSFYAQHSVLNAGSEEKAALRMELCAHTARVIREGMALLGIEVPEKM